MDKLRLGGMALHNGVMLLSPTHWSVAIYEQDGALKVYSGNHAALPSALGKIPMARGLIGLGKMFAIMAQVQAKVPNAQFAHKDPRMLVPMVSSFALTIPIAKKFGKADWRTQAIQGLLPIILQGVLLKTTPIGKFHGAEHKAVTSYEKDIPAKDAPREHPRCGTGLALTSIVSTVAINQALRRFMSPQKAQIIGQIVGTGLAVETLKASDTPVGKAALEMSILAQRYLTTSEPTDHELDAGVAALNELLKLHDEAQPNQVTIT